MNKLSEYNIIIEGDTKFIYLNTITGSIVGLNQKEHSIVQKEFNNLIDFEEKYPTIFKKFYNFGYIIDEKRNEKEEILFYKKQSVFLDREYRLFLHPTLDCNFNCWYCYEEHPKEKITEETSQRIKKHIEYMSDRISGLHLSWFGGEPLMYYDEIVEPMSLFAKNIMEQKGLTFINSISTNAYYINKKMIEGFKKIKLSTFQITLDGNREKHNKVRNFNGEPSFDVICNNIIDICNEINDASITLRINYDNKTLDYEPDFISIFPENIRHKLRIDFQRVWQTRDENCLKTEPINNKLLQWMEFAAKLGFNVNFTKLQPHIPYACYVDKYYHLEIDHEGKVYKCTAKGYTPEYEVGKLREDGIVELNAENEAKRFHKLTVENEMCLNCKYLPMCGGSCTQNSMEVNGEPICVIQSSEIPITTAILKNYEYRNNIKNIYEKNNSF
ncbi:MAG: hypothetical protein COS14_02140 [Bacteroidetes bacterium CG02_land_8_20_14_3_00_31_25]|nr:SPASM domain-containing protein [Bacteroidota bacterium]PIV62415.1 MAG: hypothetical protein COS14_02140 [Bacteroidetes bacterium CG02_land_8_20_14_3_00_31_25]PIX32876.1 MAG: hypothetical protein COZ59_11680 [Bacteroidetes bacterium CG_4_8_14_3_um_filter_31_14]PIY02806.1 MAG: hypothetical protein COZ21_12270 [Bacteroidetes bacterium CG_4_10_14_3_um_filter_31_20]